MAKVFCPDAPEVLDNPLAMGGLARVSGLGSFDRRRFLSTRGLVMRIFCSISLRWWAVVAI